MIDINLVQKNGKLWIFFLKIIKKKTYDKNSQAHIMLWTWMDFELHGKFQKKKLIFSGNFSNKKKTYGQSEVMDT